MSEQIDFFVPGKPEPGGSKSGFYSPKLKRVLISDSNKKAKPWKACVSQAASEVVTQMLEGPLKVRFDFVLTRPKGHYGSGKKANILKSSAPQFPTVRPDALKLSRLIEDSLTGIVWRDDSQIVTELLTKRYGGQAGCRVRVMEEKD